MLTIFAAIELSRSKSEIYGFDDTYSDLLKLLRVPPTQGKILPGLREWFRKSRASPAGALSDRAPPTSSYSAVESAHTTCRRRRMASRKMGIVARLIKNRGIKPGTILFLDEPETNLHPRAISSLMSALFRLGQTGVQVYLATHSYFVLKELEESSPSSTRRASPSARSCAGVPRIEAKLDDMRDGMPDSPIIDASLRLYQQGIDVDIEEMKRMPVFLDQAKAHPESGLFFNPPNDRCFRLDHSPHASTLFRSMGVQEIELGWWESAKQTMHLLEVKDYSRPGASFDHQHFLNECLQKATDCLLLLASIWYGLPCAPDAKDSVPRSGTCGRSRLRTSVCTSSSRWPTRRAGTPSGILSGWRRSRPQRGTR